MQPTIQQEFTMFINLILGVYVPFFPDRKFRFFAIQSAVLFGLVLFQVNDDNQSRPFIFKLSEQSVE